MPIFDDIMDHDLLGPAIRQGLEKDPKEGRNQEAFAFLSLLLTRRFGTVPSAVTERLVKLPTSELEEIGQRLSQPYWTDPY
jgi:hypothetical protein